jgi:mannose-1-phosphate guanylyltransferase
MAGGIGSRFWPWSREEQPKQFLDIMGTGKSLIRQTFERFNIFIPAENIFVVTNVNYKAMVNEHLPELSDNQILCEPVMRNTAPCIAYASYKIKGINENANIVVAPSDHLIEDSSEFVARIEQGLKHVKSNRVLTLGIKPSRPDTGYGYIEFNQGVENENIKPVTQFREKPNVDKAKEYLEQGNFVWNSGIFLWNVNTILQSFENHLPQIATIFKEGEKNLNTNREVSFIESNFPKCENISIDYGVMERSDNIDVMLCDFGWSDLGTWGSLYDKLQKDEKGNATLGANHFLRETTNSIVKSNPDKKIVIQGLDELIVIDTEDTLLICNKNDEQKIKALVKELSQNKK